MIKYQIDGYDFADSGVGVTKGTGLLDRPKHKKATQTDWADMNGYYIDLSKRKYEARTITLECFIKADGMMDFADKVETFIGKFETAGLHELRITLTDATRPLFYHVYLDEAVSVDKTWNDSAMVGKFTLKLIEPEPIKAVYSWTGGTNVTTVQSGDNATAHFTVRYSDDDTATQIKANGSSSKTVDAGVTAYVCVYGDIDEVTSITNSNSTAKTIWERL